MFSALQGQFRPIDALVHQAEAFSYSRGNLRLCLSGDVVQSPWPALMVWTYHARILDPKVSREIAANWLQAAKEMSNTVAGREFSDQDSGILSRSSNKKSCASRNDCRGVTMTRDEICSYFVILYQFVSIKHSPKFNISLSFFTFPLTYAKSRRHHTTCEPGRHGL